MSTYGSGRTRGRWGRRVALSISTILATGLVAPAFAQNAPLHKNVDANGVDLVDGSFNFDLLEGTIGSGPGAMSLVSYADGSSNWPANYLTQVKSGSTYTITVRVGNEYDIFSGTGTNLTSASGKGTRLIFTVGGDYVYWAPDGGKITFNNPVSTAPGGTSNLCDVNNQNNCTLLASQAAAKTGLISTLTWNVFGNCAGSPGSQNCTYSWRLASVANNAGYSIALSFVSNSTTSGSNPSADWFKRSSAVFSNANVSASSWPTATYGYPTSTTRTVTTAGGKTWRFTYDGSGRLTGIKRPSSSSSDTTTISYGTNGVTSVTRDGVTTGYSRTLPTPYTTSMVVTDALSNQTTISGDLVTYRPLAITDPLGKTTTFSYDYMTGKVSEIAFPEGNKVQYTYDTRGNATATTRKAKSGSGLADVVTTAQFSPSCVNKSICNQPQWTKDAAGNETDYSYATDGQITKIQLPAATSGGTRPEVRYTYTAVGGVSMLTGVSQCQTGASCSGTSDEVATSISYNSNLLPTSVSSGAGDSSLTATTARTYDAVGNLTTVDGPLSGTDDTTNYRWSADRELVGVISADPDGAGSLKRRAVKTTYDADGQPTVVEVGNTNGTSDTDWAAFVSAKQNTTTYDSNGYRTKDVLTASSTTYQVTQYSYDADGSLECVAQRLNSATWSSLPGSACSLGTTGGFGPDRIVKTSYDAAGHVTRTQTGYGVSGVQADEVTTTYTDNGQVASMTDAESNKTSYSYDGHDRLWKTFYPSTTKGAGTSSSTDYEQLTYDGNDNVTSRQLRDGTSIGYTYDLLSRVTAKDLPGSEPDVSYTYDLLGRMTGASQTGNALTFGYDALGRNTSQGGPLGTVSYQFDAAGRRTRLTWPDSFYVTYDYQVTGEMTAIRENGATSGVGVLATYSYDDLGRRTGITRGNGTTTGYTYDNVSRLASLSQDLASTANDVTTSFTYSPSGQIASQTRDNDAYAWTGHYNVNRGYTSNGLNQLTAAGGTSLSYDTRGNLTGSGSDSFSYSSENLMTGATVGSVSTTLSYDPALRLYQATESAGTRNFQYDGTDMVGEYNPSTGNLVRRFVFGPGTDEMVVQYLGSGTLSRNWSHTDERGTIVARSNASGTGTSTMGYDEYGIPNSNTASMRFQYTGQVWLPDLGLNYYKARMYSPALGRFMQTDPIGYGDGMNWHAYVGNDPVNGTDPLGLADEPNFPVEGHQPAIGNPGMALLSRSSMTIRIISTNFRISDDGLPEVISTGKKNSTPGSITFYQRVVAARDKYCPGYKNISLWDVSKAARNGAGMGFVKGLWSIGPALEAGAVAGAEAGAVAGGGIGSIEGALIGAGGGALVNGFRHLAWNTLAGAATGAITSLSYQCKYRGSN